MSFFATAVWFLYTAKESLKQGETQPPATARQKTSTAVALPDSSPPQPSQPRDNNQITLDNIVRNQLSLIALLVSMGGVTAAILGWWVNRQLSKFNEAKGVVKNIERSTGLAAKMALAGGELALNIALPKMNETQQIPFDACVALGGFASILEEISPEAQRMRKALKESGNGARLQFAYALHLFGKDPMDPVLLGRAEDALKAAQETPEARVRIPAAIRMGIVQRQRAGLRFMRGKIVDSIHTFDDVLHDHETFARAAAKTGLAISMLNVSLNWAKDQAICEQLRDDIRPANEPELLRRTLNLLNEATQENRLAQYYYCKTAYRISKKSLGLDRPDAQKAIKFAMKLLENYCAGRYLGDANTDRLIQLNYLQCVITLCDLLMQFQPTSGITCGRATSDTVSPTELRARTVRRLKERVEEIALALDTYSSLKGYNVTVFDEEVDREVTWTEFGDRVRKLVEDRPA